MLRVGLTGGLGSGKSTVARMLAHHGAHILESDTIGRELMMDNHSGLRDALVATFGPQVLQPDGMLDRSVLARIAFSEGRVEELNAIVHPAVIARQAELIDAIAAEHPTAVIVVESALIFETRHGGANGWRSRFDRIVLVTAPQAVRIERFVDRMAATPTGREVSREAHAQEACRRMSHQLSDEQKIALSDYVLSNNGTLADLQQQVDQLWPTLSEEAKRHA